MLLGAVVMLFAGVIYAWSVLKAPLAAEFNWTPSALALNFTLTLCFFCIGGVIAGRLAKRIGGRITILISCALILAGFFISSRVSGNIAMLYVGYGGMAGLGIGMLYVVVLSSTNAWFPDKKGTCSGVLMMCFGLSALILGKLAEKLFAVESIGWRGTYLIFGIAIAVVIAICSLMIKLPPEGTPLPAPKPPKHGGKGEIFETRDYTTSEMLKRFSFWRFFLYAILVCAVGSTVISLARDLAISVGAQASLATTLVGILSLFNGVGRIVFGFVFDLFGRRKTMILSNLITIIAPLLVLISLYTEILPLCIVGLCLTGMGYGSAATISSAFTSAFYGTKHFPSNYSVANLVLIPASFTSTLAGALLTSTGGYVAPFILLLSFAVVALGLNITIRKP